MTNIGAGNIGGGVIGNPLTVVGTSADHFILRPIADSKVDWTETPAGPAFTALDDPVSSAFTPDTADFVTSTANSQVNRMDLLEFGKGTRTVVGATAWAYVVIPASQGVTVALLAAPTSTNFTKNGAFTGWISCTYTGDLTDAQIAALQHQLQTTGTTGVGVICYAAYVDVELVSLSADTTPPVTVFVSGTRTKVSAVTGFTTDTVDWSVGEACQAWQIREVANSTDLIGVAGHLVKSGGAVPASTTQHTDITNADLSAGDGAKLLKIFAQDLAGNWST
jgi:hypothetical protein